MNTEYVDLDLDFIAHPITGDVVKRTGIESIKRSVRNLILTNFYDRPFRSYIGSNAQKILFDNISSLTARHLQDFITETITNFEPRVSLITVEVLVNEDMNGYIANLAFKMSDRLEPIITTLFLRQLR